MLLRSFCLHVLAFCFATAGWAEDKEEQKITFDDHIKPIFHEHCTACHSESDKSSDLALDSYGGALAGGSSGKVIDEGNTGASRLFALITHAERPFMPPDQDPIPKEQIALVKTWIEQGMPENSGSKIKRSNTAAAAMLATVSIGKPDGPPPMPESLLREPVMETERSAAIAAMAASPWAPLIAVGGQAQVSLYHAESGELLGVIPFPEGEPHSLTFTRDGKQLLIGGGRHSHSGCAVLVDVATGERIAKVGDELDTVLAADISPDKTRIALGGPQKIVRVFDSVSGELVYELKKHTDWIFSLRFSPDGILLASGDRSNGLIVWEADSGQLYSELSSHKGEVRAIDFRADSNVLVSASMDGTIKLWDMFESKEIKSWNAHGGGVSAVAFSNDGLIASAGRDARVKLWNGNGELQKEFPGLSEAALEVAITGDAAHIAGGDWNGNVKLWPAQDAEKNLLIAANPPSIETRLTEATSLLASVKGEFDKAQQKSEQAADAKSKSGQQLEVAQQAAQELAAKLTESTTQRETLNAQVANHDQRIEQLEAELVALKQQRAEAAKQADQLATVIGQVSGEKQAADKTVEQAQQRLAEMSAAAEAAAQSRKELEARLAAAQAAADKAAADKAALDSRAAALKLAAQESSTRVTAITEKVAAAVADKQTQQSTVDKLAEDMKSLQEQLAALQKRVAETASAVEQAQMELSSKASQATELEKELQAAEQAALEAKEQLELFEKAYADAEKTID